MNINQTNDLLTKIATELKVPGQAVWATALRHNYAIAICDIFGLILGIGLAWLAYKANQWRIKAEAEGVFEGTAPFIISVLSGITAPFLIIICAICIILRLVCPDWSTAQDIVNLFKGNS